MQRSLAAAHGRGAIAIEALRRILRPRAARGDHNQRVGAIPNVDHFLGFNVEKLFERRHVRGEAAAEIIGQRHGQHESRRS